MLLVKLAEFFGILNGVRLWFKGKKTYISAGAGMLVSGSTIIAFLLSWIDGEISANDFLEQSKVPAGAFWVSTTFLFSAMHPKNVSDKLGPGH